jgi:hypothetical protein
LEANDEWQLQHRYLSIEAFAGVSTIEEEADRFALASPAATPIFTSRAPEPVHCLAAPIYTTQVEYVMAS